MWLKSIRRMGLPTGIYEELCKVLPADAFDAAMERAIQATTLALRQTYLPSSYDLYVKIGTAVVLKYYLHQMLHELHPRIAESNREHYMDLDKQCRAGEITEDLAATTFQKVIPVFKGDDVVYRVFVAPQDEALARKHGGVPAQGA